MIQSTVTYSQIEDRLDAEYYKPEYLSAERVAVKFGNYKLLGELVSKIVNGAEIRVYYDEGVPYLRVSDIKPFFIELSDVKLVHKTSVPKKDTELKVGDVLLSRSGSIGIAAITTEDLKGSIISSHIIRLEPSGKINPYFLVAFLNSDIGKAQLLRRNNGAVVPEINQPALRSVIVPIFREKEQENISQLVIKSYQKRQLAKKKYEEARQLVNEFLGIKEEDFTFEQSFSLPFSNIEDRLDGEYYQPLELLELPMFKKGIVLLEQLTTINAGRTPVKHAYTQQGVRILKVRDLTNQGIDWDEGDRAYTKEEVWEKTKRARVKENDLLLISAAHQAYYIGQEVDIVFDIPKEYSDKLLAVAELLVVRPHKINPYLLLWYLRTQVAYRLIQRLITGETSHLYAKDLVNLPIPKKLLDFQDVKKVEGLTRESLLLKKDSKNLLEQAKQEVEKNNL